VIFKTNTIRILAWSPLLLVYAMVLATRLGNRPEYGLLTGSEIVVLAILLQPVMVMAHFSSGSNDTAQVNRHTLAFLALSLLLLVPLIVAAVSLFVADSLLLKSVSAIGVLSSTALAWAAYMRLFYRGRIDLLIPSR
jgi:hypothetical protein